jgi:carbon storage regulator
MLVLGRKFGEKIIIGDDIEIQVIDIRGDRIRIGVTAPSGISVHREEIYKLVKERERSDGGTEEGQAEVCKQKGCCNSQVSTGHNPVACHCTKPCRDV